MIRIPAATSPVAMLAVEYPGRFGPLQQCWRERKWEKQKLRLTGFAPFRYKPGLFFLTYQCESSSRAHNNHAHSKQKFDSLGNGSHWPFGLRFRTVG